MLLAVVPASVMGSACIVLDRIGGTSSNGVDGIGTFAAGHTALVKVQEGMMSCRGRACTCTYRENLDANPKAVAPTPPPCVVVVVKVEEDVLFNPPY